MSTQVNTAISLDDLFAALKEFDAQPEVQALFKKGIKYITDGGVRETISPELETRLTALIILIEATMCTGNGTADYVAWRRFRNGTGNENYWIRHGGEDAASISTKNISIAFDCMP
jgi:hypothetical protein